MLESLTFLLQGGTAPKPPAWYEVVVGVIAIPAALVGLAYSYVLVRKTRLESRKTEPEIREKELQLGSAPGPSEAAARLAEPLIQAQRVQFLILRFLLMYVCDAAILGINRRGLGNTPRRCLPRIAVDRWSERDPSVGALGIVQPADPWYVASCIRSRLAALQRLNIDAERRHSLSRPVSYEGVIGSRAA